MKNYNNIGKSTLTETKKYLLSFGRRVIGIIWTLFKVIFPIYIILVILFGFGAKGFWYLLLGLVIYVSIRIALNFKQYLNILRWGEMQIFGKPLDRQYWKKEKPKLPKLVWRKNNE